MPNTLTPKTPKASALTLCLALVAGCATEAPVVGGDAAPGSGIDAPAERPLEQEETLYTPRLQQARELLSARQLLPAASILSGLDYGKLTPGERAQALALETEIIYLKGETANALELLRRETAQTGKVDAATRQLLDDWLLRLVDAEEGALAAAKLANQLLLLTEEEQRREYLSNLVWQSLQRVETVQLQAELESARGSDWRGWLELALLAADVMESPDVQIAQLELWQERHPRHPAAAGLPGGLERLAEGAARTPRRIALLLPLSRGPSDSGRAVLEGFMAARYLARQRGWPEQELMIMDSGDYSDFATAYRNAVSAGADLMVGPLSPGMLQNWQAEPGVEVPFLTLSWLPQPAPPVAGRIPVQLDLAPEDEARQLARLAFAGGARNAMMVRPDGDWGDRISTELIETWRGLGGEVRTISVYSGQSDYSSSLKAALKLSDSEARAARIRRLLAEPTEFNPRRRQDLDVIFLLSEQPQQARSLKPLLAFHYAGDLPVYSTSHIAGGRRDPQRDRDLNGIHLLETPWSLNPGAPLPAAVAEGGAEADFANLYALGVDAFMLNWRLAQLQDTPNARIRGMTGLLHMDISGRVHRELVPASVVEGVPTAVGR